MAIISIPTSVAGVSLPGQLGNVAKGPLNALFAKQGVQTFKYPSDLGTDPTKSHYVQFSIKEIVPAGYQSSNGIVPGQTVGAGNIGKEITNLGKEAAQALTKLGTASPTSGTNPLEVIANGAVAELKNLSSTVANKIGLTPDNVTSVTRAIGSVIEKGITISPQTTKPQAVISLYMPDTLSASYDAGYTEMNLSDLGSGVNTIRNINQVAGKLGNNNISSVGDAVGAAVNMVSTDPAALSLAITAAEKLGIEKLGINTQNLGTILLKGQGYAINPQLQMIYQGIDLRNFSLSFTFTPKSADESRQIDAIIKTFKYHFSPSLQAGAQTSSDSMFLVPPSLFNIQFMLNKFENKYLPKYGDCVLKNIDVNYAPNGWAAFDDGAPVQTTLTLQFQEVQILDKEKINSGALR